MGSGIDAAREDAPEHAKMMDDLKDQLILVLVRRLGGKIMVPVDEIDSTGGVVMSMRVDQDAREFHFELKDKQ